MDSGKSNSRVAYHSGRWIDATMLSVDIRDPMVTHAVTAVERIRSYNGQFFQLDRHLSRFHRSAEQLQIDGVPDSARLIDLIGELQERNYAWIQGQSEYGALLLASPGLGITPTLIIDLYSIDSAAMKRRVNEGQALILTEVQQPSAACWPREIKTRCRVHYYLADQAARSAEPDAIGVLVDQDGSITETSIANVLVVHKETIYSPEPCQILPGISLEIIRRIAIEDGICWVDERISPNRVTDADEVLLTGTSCGIWFAKSVDGKATPTNRPIFERLRRRFDAKVVDESFGD